MVEGKREIRIKDELSVRIYIIGISRITFLTTSLIFTHLKTNSGIKNIGTSTLRNILLK